MKLAVSRLNRSANTTKTLWAGFEPTLPVENRFQVYRLNRSATTAIERFQFNVLVDSRILPTGLEPVTFGS